MTWARRHCTHVSFLLSFSVPKIGTLKGFFAVLFQAMITVVTMEESLLAEILANPKQSASRVQIAATLSSFFAERLSWSLTTNSRIIITVWSITWYRTVPTATACDPCSSVVSFIIVGRHVKPVFGKPWPWEIPAALSPLFRITRTDTLTKRLLQKRPSSSVLIIAQIQ